MNNCINLKHPDLLRLANTANIHPMVMASKISRFQEANKTDEWPTIEDLRLDMIKDRVGELSENIATYKTLEQTEDVIVRLSEAEALKVKIDEYNNRVFLEVTQPNFLIVNENKELYKAANLLADDGNSKFLKTAKEAKNWVDKLNIDKDFKDYIFTARPAMTQTMNGFRIFISRKPDASGQLSLFELSKIISNPTEAPSESTDSKTFSATFNKLFNQMVIEPLKVSRIGSKWALRVAYEIAKNLSERTGIEFEVISEDKAKLLMGKRFSFGTSGFYDPDNNKAYLVEGKFTAGTAVHEIFGHPFLELIKSNPEYSDLYKNLVAEAKTNNDVLARMEGYAGSDLDIIDKEFVTNYLSIAIDKNILTVILSTYFKAFTSFLKKLFNVGGLVEEIKPTATLSQVTDWLLFRSNEMSLISKNQADQVRYDIANNINNELVNNYNSENGVRTKEQSISGINKALESNESIDNIKNSINNANIYLEKVKVEPNFMMTSSKFKATKDAIVKNLKAQLKSIERKPNASKIYKDELDKLIKTLSKEESYNAAITFILHAINEVDKVDKAMTKMMDDMYENKRLDSSVIEAAKADCWGAKNIDCK